MRRSSKHRSRGPRKDGEKRAGFSRRSPPPDNTGLERAYLETRRSSGEPVTISLESGETIEGKVTEFDEDLITIEPEGGAAIVVRKSEVRYLAADS